jgi:hypothetical protein
VLPDKLLEKDLNLKWDLDPPDILVMLHKDALAEFAIKRAGCEPS